jgi:phospholipase/lecithinase/hemolysin
MKNAGQGSLLSSSHGVLLCYKAHKLCENLPFYSFGSRFLDINTIFVPLVLNPALFGFSNSTSSALATIPFPTHPDDYVFWDGFHPTTKVHLITAKFINQFASRGFDFSVLSSR